MRRIAALSARLALMATLGLTGCCYYELRDSLNETCFNVRTCCSARSAWWECESNFDNHPQKKYFGIGFRDGYSSVAQGGDGCCPTIPPRNCWGWCYDECEGQERMHAWFDGWAAGAMAAEADGLVGNGRLAFRQPGCTSCCNGGCPTSFGGGTIISSPGEAHIMLPPPPTGAPPVEFATPVGPAVLPPSPPPTMTPAPPADEAYEGYNADGVYYVP